MECSRLKVPGMTNDPPSAWLTGVGISRGKKKEEESGLGSCRGRETVRTLKVGKDRGLAIF